MSFTRRSTAVSYICHPSEYFVFHLQHYALEIGAVTVCVVGDKVVVRF